ncbi:hypothetical protein [Achromobacter phage nyashin_LB6]|nr:hypothetical protein [Achromobacter phage nyashin_LB6]
MKNVGNRLFDALTRQQVYVAGVALQFAAESIATVDEVIHEAERIVGRFESDTLNESSQKAFLVLLGSIIKFLRTRFDAHTAKRMKQLEELTAIERRMNARIMATVETESPTVLSEQQADKWIKDKGRAPVGGMLLALSAPRLWASMSNEPMGPGLLLSGLVANLGSHTEKRAAEIIRQARANGWTRQETIAELERLRGQLRVEAMSAAMTQASAVSQRVHEVLQATGSTDRYMWISVLDSRTTEICRSRSRRIYVYGRGPVPPAHYRCRSHIVPYYEGMATPESFAEWVNHQSPEFINSVYTPATAKAILNGTVERSTIERFQAEKPLSLTRYADMIDDILSVR